MPLKPEIQGIHLDPYKQKVQAYYTRILESLRLSIRKAGKYVDKVVKNTLFWSPLTQKHRLALCRRWLILSQRNIFSGLSVLSRAFFPHNQSQNFPPFCRNGDVTNLSWHHNYRHLVKNQTEKGKEKPGKKLGTNIPKRVLKLFLTHTHQNKTKKMLFSTQIRKINSKLTKIKCCFRYVCSNWQHDAKNFSQG